MIWRVRGGSICDAPIKEALRRAVEEVCVLPALHRELGRRGIAIEAIAPP